MKQTKRIVSAILAGILVTGVVFGAGQTAEEDLEKMQMLQSVLQEHI
jgi:outer membrane lipoprotein-sorting protein